MIHVPGRIRKNESDFRQYAQTVLGAVTYACQRGQANDDMPLDYMCAMSEFTSVHA